MDLPLLFVGIYVLIKGDVKISKDRKFSKRNGRIMGLFLMFPFVYFFSDFHFQHDSIIIYGSVLAVLVIIGLKTKTVGLQRSSDSK